MKAMLADVSKRGMDVAWGNRACESRYSTASVVLCALERSSFTQCNFASTFKHSNVQGQTQLPNED